MSDTQEELLEAALEEIGPSKEERERCRRQILFMVRAGSQSIAAREDLTAGAWRKEIDDYRVAARRFFNATKKLSRLSRETLFNGGQGQFVTDLKAIMGRANQLANRGIPRKASGNSPPDPVLTAAANWALALLDTFSDEPPSKTTGGRYQKLTAYLYEYVGGDQPISVERVCDHELDKFRAARDERSRK